MAPTARSVVIAVSVGAAALAAFMLPAHARGGGHGFGGGRGGMHGAHFAGGGRHGNDSYIKAASDERDKLLNTKLKTICRGC
jgi:hypothetical protein